MSKGNSAVKVLRTALKRVQKGWTKNTWSHKNDDGSMSVCLEGALFGYCSLTDKQKTPSMLEAEKLVKEIIAERYPKYGGKTLSGQPYVDIPSFNDAQERVQEEVEEVVKLALIRAETGGLEDDPEIEDEDFSNLLEFMAK